MVQMVIQKKLRILKLYIYSFDVNVQVVGSALLWKQNKQHTLYTADLFSDTPLAFILYQ